MIFSSNGLRAVFSVHGRVGRVRYIAWRSGVLFMSCLVFIGLSLLTGLLPPGWSMLMGLLILLTGLSALVLYTLPAVRRAHDFNASGWLALVSLIPLVNLVFWFIPGTAGVNRHGDAPPANSRPVIVSAVLLTLLVLVMSVLFTFLGFVSHQLAIADRDATTEQTPVSPDQPEQEP